MIIRAGSRYCTERRQYDVAIIDREDKAHGTHFAAARR